MISQYVFSKLERESDRVFHHGSSVSAMHIREFTSDLYHDINLMLVRRIPERKHLLTAVRAIDNAIKLFNLEDDLTVFSGDLRIHFTPIVRKGQLFDYPKYVSTSLHKQRAQTFALRPGSIMLEIDVPKGSKVLYIGDNSKAATDFGLHEYELLIARNTRFEVLSINKGYLRLKVIPHEN